MSITSESWWGREIVPAALNGFFRRCCGHFDSDPMGGGTKGNAAHTTGRHRSFEWVLHSAYCTDRSYGTRDQRDRDGNPQHIRAVDVKLTPAQMRDVCHRLDAAVRAGDLPQLAEWFGTFDNKTVVGWYEGHPSSADSSHLEHVHMGVWTKYADDQAALDQIFNVMTGEDMPTAAEIAKAVWDCDQVPAPPPPVNNPDWDKNKTWQADNALSEAVIVGRKNAAAIAALDTKLDQILAALAGGTLPPNVSTTSGKGTFTWTADPPA